MRIAVAAERQKLRSVFRKGMADINRLTLALDHARESLKSDDCETAYRLAADLAVVETARSAMEDALAVLKVRY